MIKVSVLITTLNEAENLPRCLSALQDFDDIIVIDSGSTDKTVTIAKSFDAHVESFQWNKKYPKKRQWCLDNLSIKNDWIFFVDGDEEVTPELVQEIQSLNWQAAGYFVKGRYIWREETLFHGLSNNKLVLFNRHKVEFPVVDDLDIEGMGEMEGHYQPVLKKEYREEKIEQLKNYLRHFAYEDKLAWKKRHERYANWEAQMIKRNAYPRDPDAVRQFLKRIFRHLPFRGSIVFFYSYFLKLGFLDGIAGFQFARSRFNYYQMVSSALKTNKIQGKDAVGNKEMFAPQK